MSDTRRGKNPRGPSRIQNFSKGGPLSLGLEIADLVENGKVSLAKKGGFSI